MDGAGRERQNGHAHRERREGEEELCHCYLMKSICGFSPAAFSPVKAENPYPVGDIGEGISLGHSCGERVSLHRERDGEECSGSHLQGETVHLLMVTLYTYCLSDCFIVGKRHH